VLDKVYRSGKKQVGCGQVIREDGQNGILVFGVAGDVQMMKGRSEGVSFIMLEEQVCRADNGDLGLKVAGPTGRFKRSLLKKVHLSGGESALVDEEIGAVLRQCLWQWGYELTPSEYERAMRGDE
jgi:hypothetical protein